MGFSVPAAIGAKVGRPDRMVWAVDGDGCFQMTAQELVTASTERIPVKIAILNNAYLGMVRQWQEMFYEERYSEVYLSPDLPDYVKWAEAMGCVGLRVESPEEVGPPSTRRTRSTTGRSCIEFRTDCLREGVPDGARPARPTTTSSSTRPRATRLDAAVHERSPCRPKPPSTTCCRCWWRTAPACWPGSSSLFARRGYNIYSLAVAPTDDERFSRITIVVDVESAPLEQIVKQLNKLINVIKISELDPRDSVERELMMVTVKAPPATRGEIIELVGVFDGRIARRRSRRADRCRSTSTPSASTTSSSCSRPYGIVDLQRTGRVALPKLERLAAPGLRSAG